MNKFIILLNIITITNALSVKIYQPVLNKNSKLREKSKGKDTGVAKRVINPNNPQTATSQPNKETNHQILAQIYGGLGQGLASVDNLDYANGLNSQIQEIGGYGLPNGIYSYAFDPKTGMPFMCDPTKKPPPGGVSQVNTVGNTPPASSSAQTPALQDQPIKSKEKKLPGSGDKVATTNKIDNLHDDVTPSPASGASNGGDITSPAPLHNSGGMTVNKTSSNVDQSTIHQSGPSITSLPNNKLNSDSNELTPTSPSTSNQPAGNSHDLKENSPLSSTGVTMPQMVRPQTENNGKLRKKPSGLTKLISGKNYKIAKKNTINIKMPDIPPCPDLSNYHWPWNCLDEEKGTVRRECIESSKPKFPYETTYDSSNIEAMTYAHNQQASLYPDTNNYVSDNYK